MSREHAYRQAMEITALCKADVENNWTWQNGAQAWKYPYYGHHSATGSEILFIAPMCGVMINPAGPVRAKQGTWGWGYQMDDISPTEIPMSEKEKALLLLKF